METSCCRRRALSSTSLMSLPQRPYVVVANGKGVATADTALDPKRGEYRWKFIGLEVGSSIVALDSKNNILAQIPVKRLDDAKSYKPIMVRFNSRGMKIDLDSHIDYVCYASDILGEGISFRPKSAAEFKTAITDAQLFHHDDRSDFFGKKAASATIGEGYREVSTPSLHVAISSEISSVHIDSHSFIFKAPDGNIIIGPDAGQHIVDELWFRLPMTWLRRKDMPFIASVLQCFTRCCRIHSMDTSPGSGFASNSAEPLPAIYAPACLASPLKPPLTSPSTPPNACAAKRRCGSWPAATRIETPTGF